MFVGKIFIRRDGGTEGRRDTKGQRAEGQRDRRNVAQEECGLKKAC